MPRGDPLTVSALSQPHCVRGKVQIANCEGASEGGGGRGNAGATSDHVVRERYGNHRNEYIRAGSLGLSEGEGTRPEVLDVSSAKEFQHEPQRLQLCEFEKIWG